MVERTQDRRVQDRIFKAAFVFVLACGVFSTGLQLWIYTTMRSAIARGASNRLELYQRLDLVNENADIVAEQLALLRREQQLFQEQHRVLSAEQDRRLDRLDRWRRRGQALEQATRDRAGQR